MKKFMLTAGSTILFSVGCNILDDWQKKEYQKKLGKLLAEETEQWLALNTPDK